MWVRLKVIKVIDRNGKNHTYHPGDWVDVGKQTALLWMSSGDADIPSFKREQFVAGEAGVVIRGVETVTPFEDRFSLTKLTLSLITSDLPYIAFNKTLCWSPKVPLRVELVAAGFSFLDTWEIAAPIYSYDELAIHIGSDAARSRTQKVIRDLRVPVYDTRLIFVKHCENTQRLFEAWQTENETGDDDRLTFLRSFYAVKPLMLALPVTWVNERAYAEVV